MSPRGFPVFIKVKILFVFEIMAKKSFRHSCSGKISSDDEHCSMKNSRVSSRAQIRSFAVFITLRCGESKKWDIAAKNVRDFYHFIFSMMTGSHLSSRRCTLCVRRIARQFSTPSKIYYPLFFSCWNRAFSPSSLLLHPEPRSAFSLGNVGRRDATKAPGMLYLQDECAWI